MKSIDISKKIKFWEPRRWFYRCFILVLTCFLTFGSYFCYDSPGALQDIMMNDLNLTTSELTLFYSLYSWPNVVLCFFGGILLDKIVGLSWGTIIFSSFVTIGQILFSIGAFYNRLWLMYLGRFIFGAGDGSLQTTQSAFAVKWFENKALNMVFGLQLSVSRVGSTVGMVSLQPLYKAINGTSLHGHVCLGVTLFVGALICMLCLIFALILVLLDKRAAKILIKIHPNHIDANRHSTDHENQKNNDKELEKTFQIKDLKTFTAEFWLLSGICVSYYVSIFPFISLALVFYEKKYGLSYTEASVLNSLIYIISACASPLVGFCVDRTGRNITWIFFGVLATLACHAILTFTSINPYVPVVIMGLCLAVIASVLWPIVSFIVSRKVLGTAYGLMQSILSLGLALTAIAAGKILDVSNYFMLGIFFQLCLLVASICTVGMYFVDKKKGGLLNLSANARRSRNNILKPIESTELSRISSVNVLEVRS